MMVYPGTRIQCQIVAAICDRALGYPISPQGWDGTPLNTLTRCDSVPSQYAGTSRQSEYFWTLSAADCYYPLPDSTLTAVAASPYINAGDKSTVASAGAARISVGNPNSGGRVPESHYIGGVCYWLGDSLTAANGTTHGGMRYYLKAWETALGYRTNQVGPSEWGDFLDCKHGGVGGDTCSNMNSRAPGEIAGTQQVVLAFLLAGSNDAFLGSPTSDYQTLLATVHSSLVTYKSTARIAVSFVPPRSDVDVTAYNSALTAFWDAHDSAHPSNTLIRWNAFAAVGGVWSSTYFYDSVHLNDAGYQLVVSHPTYGLARNAQSYLSQIGAYP